MSGLWITLRQGQSAESLAFEQGHFLDTVWQHAENHSLRSQRKVPHILFPGDRLFVPTPVVKSETGVTDKRHRFRVRGVPSRITFQLRSVLGETLAQVPYKLVLPGRTIDGTTDANGKVTAPVLADAETGVVLLEWKGQSYEIRLGMRALDPIDTLEGVQKRLQNLGLYTGEIDGLFLQSTIWAVQQFQMLHGLPTTGSIDDSTREKLLSVHGC